MAHAIRLTLKASCATRQAFPEKRHAYLKVRARSSRSPYAVADGNLSAPPFGRLVPRPISLDEATHFDTRQEALEALAGYILHSGWDAGMWVKNPQIVEVEA